VAQQEKAPQEVRVVELQALLVAQMFLFVLILHAHCCKWAPAAVAEKPVTLV
jgi:hypothetical protein